MQEVPVSKNTLKQLVAAPNYGNDYNTLYLHTGQFPQSHVQNIDDIYEGYPKLQRLHERKKEVLDVYSDKPTGLRCLASRIPQTLQLWAASGLKFDVVMLHGCISEFPSRQYWRSLPIQQLTPRPSILLVWVAASKLEKGRALLELWGFRRSEEIVFMVSKENSAFIPPQADTQALFRSTTWYCIMGLRGTLRRSVDKHLINCNIDTDVIIEGTHTKANVVPEDIYTIVENFALMGRRLHVVPVESPYELPVRPRRGWTILSPDSLLSNFDPTAYKPLLRVPVDQEIEILRPQTPPAKEKPARRAGLRS